MPDNVTLYDAYNRPIIRQALTVEIAKGSMTGVRRVWNESVASGLTPDRLAALLRNAGDGNHDDYLTLAEEMEERDLHYGSELSKRKLAVTRLPITLESASDSSKDKEIADAVRAMLKKGGFRWLLRDLMDSLGKGFSVVEIIWDRTGSTWKPKEYKWRDPHWFCWDRDTVSKISLLDESDMVNGIELAPYKFITHTPRLKSGIPIRSGFARLAAWAYMCKGYTVKDWMAFAEVFGMPMRMGKYGPGAGKTDIEILKLAVANLGTDAAAVFPDSMQVEFVEASKSGSTDFFERLAQYLDNMITKGILGQTATTQGTPGKLGNEDAQQEVRHDIRDDDAEQLEETIQRDLIQVFVDLNFGPQESYPQFQLRAVEKEDTAALVNALKELVPLGLKVEQSVVRDKLGFPDPDPHAKPEDLLGAPPEPLQLTEMKNDSGMNRAMNSVAVMPLDDIDSYVDTELEDWVPIMNPVIDPIREALESSETVEGFERKWFEMIDEQDLSELVKRLGSALYKARVAGLSDEGVSDGD
jgi:phage gp29-like protein